MTAFVYVIAVFLLLGRALAGVQLNGLLTSHAKRVSRPLLLLLLTLAGATSAVATNFTTTVPGTSIVIPSTYPQAGGVVIVLEGANGNVYYQFANPSTMYQGYSNSGTPVAWQGNPMQVTPAMALFCGPVVSCSTYLGGSITRMSVRFTAYDGDNQVGMFDYNDLNLRINGANFGANSGNWSPVTTQNTDITGTTLISSGTGFGNNTLDTGWFQSTDATILSGVLTTGSVTASILDKDPTDNFWDFKRGNDADTTTVPLNVAPGVTLDKASTTTSFATVGQVIPYTFTYRNVGSVWIKSVSISDPKVTGVSCPAPPAAGTVNLDPGEQVVCTANYSVTQADIDAGTIVNTATATGTPQAGSLGPVTDTNTITGPASAPSVLLTKTATPSPFGLVGSTLTYGFAVRNTGNVTLSSIAITDPSLASLSCTSVSIAPGVTATLTCTGNTRTITQTNVDAGSIANTATVSARAPNGTTVTNPSSVTTPGPTRAGGIALVKTAGSITDLDSNGQDVGDTIVYSFVVSNTGNVTLTSVGVTDAKVGAITCPVTTLLPAGTTTCTKTYTLTQADVDAGNVTNTATATGTPPSGVAGPVTDVSGSATTNNNPTVTPITRTPALFLDKTSPTTNYNTVGAVITYSYLVRNAGNVTLTNAITIADNKATVTCPPLPGGILAPTSTITCSATHTVTQADIDAGSVLNTATANTTFGATPVASPSDQVTVPAVQTRSMTVDKNATAVAFTSVGDIVSYEYIVTNTGNTTLTSAITVTDNRVTPVICPALPPGGIAPAATLTCTANYSVLLEDLDIGSITNLASASNGTTTSPLVSETVPAGANPALTIDKTSVTPNFNVVGDVIAYSFLVTNSGNATLTRTVNVSDSKIGNIVCWVPPTTGPPAGRIFTPGQTRTCSGSYTVTQADLDVGFVTNQANAATTYGAANIPVTSPPDNVTVNAIQNPALTVTKAAVTLPVTAVGQVLTYTITTANTGDVTLSGIVVTDPLIPSLACSIATLAPTAQQVCTGTYTVTQADFDAGQIVNTATANGVTPQGAGVSGTGNKTVPITQVSSVTIAKTFISNADQDASGTVTLNDSLSYKVTVTNDGNVTQGNVVVSDALLTPSSITCATVAPGGTCVLNGSLSVTQSRVDAGTVANTASVTTTLLPTPETATRNVPVAQLSALTLDKQTPVNGDQDSSGTITLNDVLTYTVVMSNTGTVTQTAVVVSDPLLTPSSITCASVAPGNTCILTGTKTVTQANVDAGTITNTASVISALVTSPVTDSVTTPVAQSSSVSIAKTLFSNADQDTSASITRNDTLTYKVTVSNDGTLTQNAVLVSDPLLTPSSTTCASVAPGATCVLTGTYTVTQANVDAGSIGNTGSVTTTLLPTAETATISTPISQAPGLSVDKTSITANYDSVGDLVAYSYLIRNTGNVTLSGTVSVTDNKVSVSCPALPPAGLAPNATHTCSASYAVTQADLDSGSVINTASAKIGTTTSPTDSVTINAVQLPALSIDKTSSTASFRAVGDTLTYSYLLRNTGNITLTGAVSVADDKTSVICPALPPAGLAPNATITCSATYGATQADIDAGSVINTASGTVGTTSSSTDQVTVPAIQTPSMSIDKNAININFTSVGDTIDYEYVIINTGNTTLFDPIVVTDNRVTPVDCDTFPAGGLLPGDKYICKSTYFVLLEDLEIGSITNLAFATSGPTNSPQTSELVPTGSNPALNLKKYSDTTAFSAVGEVIKYQYDVTNSGNATFTRPIDIVDDKLGTNLCYTPAPVFKPGETATCAFNYVVTQDDMDAGFVTNQAYAATTYSKLDIPITSAPESVTIPGKQNPGLAVSKSAVTLPVASVGQVLTYTITVENPGNVTLSNINVTDPLIPALSCVIAKLSPGDSNSTCVGTYTVTQTDYDIGGIDNTANARGVTPQGDGIENNGVLNVAITQVSSISIAKAYVSNTDQDASGSVTLDDTLNYAVTVTNDGNVTQGNVVVTDALLTPSTITCASVAPGGTCVLNGSLSVTQTRVDAGTVANTASVTTTLLPTPETDAETVPVAQLSAMTLDKQVPVNGDQDSSGSITLNDVLTYTVVMANSGTVTQTAVVVSDPLLTPASITCASVAPGNTCILSGTYTVTQANVDAGTLVNTASVVSTLVTTPLTDSVTTPVAQTPSVSIAKALFANADEDTSSSISLNDSLTYTVTVSNDGSVTQNAVVVSDALLTPASTTCASVAPGGTCVLTGTYTVTQGNVDAGSIGNTGSVTTTLLPTPETVTIATPVPQLPGLSVDKTSPTANYAAVGDLVSYSYLLTNTGNVTLTGTVSASDNKTSVSCPALPPGGLAPGATHTCSATYAVTQADLDAGSLTNTASATIGTTTSASDQATVPALQTPALSVDKTSPTASFNAVGDVISYSYLVTNAGNVTLAVPLRRWAPVSQIPRASRLRMC